MTLSVEKQLFHPLTEECVRPVGCPGASGNLLGEPVWEENTQAAPCSQQQPWRSLGAGALVWASV